MITVFVRLAHMPNIPYMETTLLELPNEGETFRIWDTDVGRMFYGKVLERNFSRVNRRAEICELVLDGNAMLCSKSLSDELNDLAEFGNFSTIYEKHYGTNTTNSN